MPRPGDRPGRPLDEPGDEAAVVELCLQLGLVEPAPAHPAEHRDDPHQHDQVEHTDQDEEHSRDHRAGHPGHLLQQRRLVLKLPGQRTHPQRQQRHQHEHDRGVAQREPEADRDRAPAVGQLLAGGVVDGGDVVGVEGVPHADGVGGEAQAQPEHPASDTGQLGGRNEGGQDPPAGDVKHEDEPRHAEDGPQLGASDGPTAQSFACHFSVHTVSL